MSDPVDHLKARYDLEERAEDQLAMAMNAYRYERNRDAAKHIIKAIGYLITLERRYGSEAAE